VDEDYLAGPELNEALIVAKNRPLWRLMSTFDTTRPWWCVPQDEEEEECTYSCKHSLLDRMCRWVRRFLFYAVSQNC